MSKISDAVLDRELRKIFSQKGFDMDSETFKTLRTRLCKSLGLQEFPSEQKATLKDMIRRILNEKEEEQEEKDFSPKKRQLKDKAVLKIHEYEDKDEEEEGSNDEVSDEEEEEIFKRKEKKKAFKQKEEKNRAPESSFLPYSSDVKSLLDLGTAMRMGPNLHRGLKSMDNFERMEMLTKRLEMAGASWKGKIPSKADVLKAKQKRQRQEDMDGLDPSVILETTGRRRGAVVSYAHDIDEEEEDKDDEDEDEAVLKKSKKKAKQESGDDDDDDDDNDFDSESSSEDEFND
jgi:hypothetical protein